MTPEKKMRARAAAWAATLDVKPHDVLAAYYRHWAEPATPDSCKTLLFAMLDSALEDAARGSCRAATWLTIASDREWRAVSEWAFEVLGIDRAVAIEWHQRRFCWKTPELPPKAANVIARPLTVEELTEREKAGRAERLRQAQAKRAATHEQRLLAGPRLEYVNARTGK
jgi:hypothetical protein